MKRAWWPGTISIDARLWPRGLERGFGRHLRPRDLDLVGAVKVLRIDETHADHAAQRRAVPDRRQLTGRLAIAQDGLAAPRKEVGRREREHQKALRQFGGRLAPLGAHRESEPCLVWRAVGRELGAERAPAGFDAQRVERVVAAVLQAERLAGGA